MLLKAALFSVCGCGRCDLELSSPPHFYGVEKTRSINDNNLKAVPDLATLSLRTIADGEATYLGVGK